MKTVRGACAFRSQCLPIRCALCSPCLAAQMIWQRMLQASSKCACPRLMPLTLLLRLSMRVTSGAISHYCRKCGAAQGQIGRGKKSKGDLLRPCDILSAARADRAIVRFKLQPHCMTAIILEDLAALGWPARRCPAEHRRAVCPCCMV